MDGRQSVNWLNHLRQGSRATARAATAFALAVALAVFGVPASSAAAPKPSTITVNTTNEAEVDGLCSLREAVLAANTNQQVDGCKAGGSTDVISVPEATYILTQGELVLERTTEIRGFRAVLRRPVGQVPVPPYEPIVRVAPTADAVLTGVIINGSPGLCSALVNEGILLMIDGSVTENFRSVTAACANSGAAFDNLGTATLLRPSLMNNVAELVPSAFTNSGTLRIVDGVISGNTSIRFQRFGLTFTSDNRGNLSLEGTAYRQNGVGSLRNSGKLTARNSSFQGSVFLGLLNEGDAHVERSSFIGNGRGILNSGSLRVDYSSIEENSNSGFGGPVVAGIDNSGTLLLEHSSVTGNRGTGTGGVLSSGTMSIRDSTIAGNLASAWSSPVGGFFNSDGAGGVTVTGGTAQFTNVTLVDNRNEPSTDDPPPSRISGGLYVAEGSVSVANSVLALNQHNQSVESNGLDCTGPVTSLGYTYLQHPTGCSFTGATGDITGGSPQLGPLGSHGGPTLTMVPLPGSPLIDYGSPAKVGSKATNACSRLDQRGGHRPVDADSDGVARCDIGAVERQPSDSTDTPPS